MRTIKVIKKGETKQPQPMPAAPKLKKDRDILAEWKRDHEQIKAQERETCKMIFGK